MTNRVSKLVLAAVLASSVPIAARAACDQDAMLPPAWSPPAASRAYPGYPTYPAPGRWREARWRERELAEVRAELRALDAERSRFYATYAGRPGKVRKFERWYAGRRAELERRWYDLQPVAWR